MLINGVEYKIIDTIEKMTVPDCFVVTKNKIGTAHGEAKFYVGSRNKQQVLDFLGSEVSSGVQCFILKKDLIKYLEEAKDEYLNPEQNYRNKSEFPILFESRLNLINNLEEIEFFNLIKQDQIEGDRLYLSSEKETQQKFKYIGYQILRELSLPKITYLAAIKLQANDGSVLFYFRLFIDYFDSEENQIVVEKELEKIEQSSSNAEEKLQLTKARIGQGKYRTALIEECPFCPVTMITDERLLIASHIKPWAKSTDNEKIDSKNGFMFTPTIDRLFDRGFISFSNDKKMLLSPWLSKMTYSRLNISPDKKYEWLPVEGREAYLQYHRESIFKS